MTNPTVEEVAEAYRVILGREPQGPDEAQTHAATESHQRMVSGILMSQEARNRLSALSPFFHYNSSIDARALVERNILQERQPVDGHNVNFLGVAVPVEVFPFLAGTGGLLDQIPIPANYHADMAEWAAAIRAVDLASGAFSMIELGSGWGCWMVNTGVLAKRRGLKIDLIGVEGDPHHVALCQKTMRSNNIAESEYQIVRGVASADHGVALFPKRKEGEDNWGFEPVFGATEEQQSELADSYDALPMIPLSDVIADREKIDLLHIDIQGAEVDVIGGALQTIKEKVRYLLIGTHSRAIDGQLIAMLQKAGFVLEIERPTIFDIEQDGTLRTVTDGVQGWRNPSVTG